MQKLGSGAAAVAVAGSLTVGIGLGSAAPAQALLPVIPVVVGAVGGTAVAGAVSGWALAGYAALTAGVVGLSMAIKDNGNVWIQNAVDFFTPGEEVKAESPPSVTNPPTMPNTEGSYVWQTSLVTISSWSADKFQFTGAPRPINRININLAYSGSGIGAAGIRIAYVMENTCKKHSDGSIYNEVRYNQGGILQGASGYNTLSFAVGCAKHDVGEIMQTRIRAPTTFEKYDPAKFAMVRGSSYDGQYMWAGEEIFWKSADSSFVDPGFRATVECVNTSGVKSTLSLDSGFQGDGKVAIPSCKAAGLSEVANSLKIDYLDGTRTVTPAIKTVPNSDQFLECDAAFGNFCKLEIYIDGMPCVVGTVQCAGWVSQHLADPSRVKCFYGTREVSISNCGVLEGAYAYGGSPATTANTDGDPNTWDDPAKVPGWSPLTGPNGEPTSNPDPNVQPNPDNNPNIQPEPSTDPGPGTEPAPDTGTGTGTNPIPTTGTNPSGPNPGGQGCMGSGWSWNPVSWVMVPVQCAMQWAFVPKVDVKTRITNMQGKFADKAPVSWFGGNVSNVSGGACPANWAITVAGERVSFICGTPVENIILGFRPVLAGMLIVAALWPLVRSLFYSSIPILKVNPS